MKKLFYCTLLFVTSMLKLNAQTEVLLYEGAIPNSKPAVNKEKSEITDGNLRISNISVPTYTLYKPSNQSAKRAAIIIFPGGGYTITSSTKEGVIFAKALNEMGITAILIKYRMPNDTTMINKEIGPLQDGQQAILLARENAEKWNIDPNKIGIMGFSAGGHLAATAGTHFMESVIPNPNHISVRPDFMVLAYPVISLQDSLAHMGSRNNLLGKNPTQEKKDLYSNELHVTNQTPPTFLVHSSDDASVQVANSILFYQALVAHHVKAEIHTFQNGGHGFGLINKTSQDSWLDRCKFWMISNGWL